MNKIDLVSKLLAEENISIRRAMVRTASFNIKTRELTLPIKFNLSESQEMMLILHEVGHALFTTEKYIQFQEQYKKPGFQNYLNCVEDARIERMMKDRYPGSRKDFFTGYNEFHAADFFGLRGRDVNSMNLIDRVNLYFKLGSRINARFNQEERRLVRLVEVAKTELEVFEAAKAIYEFASQPENQQKKEEQGNNFFDDEDSEDDGGDFGDEMDSSEEESDSGEDQDDATDGESTDEDEEQSRELDSAQSNDSQSNENEDDQFNVTAPEAETQGSFDSFIEDSVVAEDSSFFQVNDISCETYIFPAENVIKYIKTDSKTLALLNNSKFSEFTLKNDNLVNSMVKEFLMKRAAEQYRRTTVAKSGSLDINKLSQYQIADDIFKKYNITCDTTSHGILVLLDWSGSIQRQLHDLIKQVITVVKFCRKVDIKCEVYAFSSGCFFDRKFFKSEMVNVSSNYPCAGDDYKKVRSKCPTTLIQFMTSTMRKSDFSYIAEKLFCFSTMSGGSQYQLPHNLWLDSTPLMPAVKFALDYIPTFRQKYNVQKVTLTVLTDGVDTATYVPGEYYNRGKQYLRDPITNKFHIFTKNRTVQTTPSVTHVLLKMIRERYDYVTTVGFLIFSSKKQLLSCLWSWDIKEQPESISRGSSVNGVHVMETQLFHKMFASRIEVETESLNVKGVNSEMTSSQISRIFNKSSNSLGKTKVFVKSFVETIA